MKYCCLCGNPIIYNSKEQFPMGTKFGLLCTTCVSQGKYEKMINLKTIEDFKSFKRQENFSI